jgi:lysophospholipase L1-like esterase
MRVLVFGPSAVQGFWDVDGGWVGRLRKHYDKLQMKDFFVEQPCVMNLGISGEETSSLLERMENEAKARENDKGISFVISVGGNDSSLEDGQLKSTPEVFKSEAEKLIEKARQYSDKIMFVGLNSCDESLTNPVAWADIYFRNELRVSFEKITQELCEQQKVPFVPIFEIFYKKMTAGEKLLAHDGLHPNSTGHELIFQLIRPELDKLLAK